MFAPSSMDWCTPPKMHLAMHQHIGSIHLAGGRRIEGDRVLDDHLHAVPQAVYDLLGAVDAPAATLILERDGNYPSIEVLLAEIDRAREVVATAPARLCHPADTTRAMRSSPSRSSAALLPFLARLYTNDDARSRFLDAPDQEAIAAGLTDEEALALSEINAGDLVVAARSFAKKRRRKMRASGKRWYERLLQV
jgi:hypothetical protein